MDTPDVAIETIERLLDRIWEFANDVVVGIELASVVDAATAIRQDAATSRASLQSLASELERVKAERDDFEQRFVETGATLAMEQSARKATEAELERVSNNRDMWKGQCEHQAAQLTQLREALTREREACADIADEHVFDAHELAQATEYGQGMHAAADEIAKAIRARSEKPGTGEVG